MAEKPKFELLHLWNAEIEAPALSVLRDAVEASGHAFTEHRVAGNFYGVRTAFAKRYALDNPPSAVFWIGGLEAASMVRDKLFRPITRDMTTEDLRAILDPDVNRESHIGDAEAALPVVIHLQNIALFNKAAFERLGLELPTSWKHLLGVAEKLKTGGIVPLAMSDQRWQLRFLFTAILAEGLDPEAFRTLLLGQLERPLFIAHVTAAFETLRALQPYVNPDFRDLAWNHVVKQVIDGKAAMTITGDFASPATIGIPDVTCRRAPGNDFSVWSFDLLAFPRQSDPAKVAAQDAVIKRLATKSFLTRFGQLKGGIPVVRGVEPDPRNRCAANAVKIWEEPGKVHFNSEQWRLQLNFISSVARRFIHSTDMSEGQAAQALLSELRAISK